MKIIVSGFQLKIKNWCKLDVRKSTSLSFVLKSYATVTMTKNVKYMVRQLLDIKLSLSF